MGEAVAATVVDFREKRREQREREFKDELRSRGIHTRELVLLHLEACRGNMEYWHGKAMLARYLNARMLELLRLANKRCAESKALAESYAAEVERLRGLIE